MVERFKMTIEYGWVCSRTVQDGDWVRYTDYAALSVKFAEVERERDEAKVRREARAFMEKHDG